MRNFSLLFLVMVFFYPGITQTGNLTLKEAYRQAKANHPFGKRKALLEEATRLSLEQIDAGRLPGISLNAEGRFQSENVRLPFEIPGQEPIELPLLTAQAAVEAQYMLFDGGLAEARREMERSELLVAQQRVSTDLYQLNKQVDQAFFSVLLMRARQAILENNLGSLEARVAQLQAGVRQGAVLPETVNELEVEMLRLESEIDETRGQQQTALRSLRELTGLPLSDSSQLVIPDLSGFSIGAELQRPELQLFEQQKSSVLAREQLLTASRKPKISAFARGGIGYPNPLNFFDTELSPFGLVGLQFSWKVFDWNKTDLERQSLYVQSRLVENSREAFEYQIQIEEEPHLESIATLERLLERDEAIVELQQKILSRSSAKLDSGVITPAEYLDQLNASIQAQLQLESHRLQLKQTKVNYLTLKGLH